MSENTGILLETKDLSKYFTAKKGLLNRNPSVVKAVDHVSLSVRKGETLGLVGESGCGKSTLGRTILRLIPATEGQVMYNGEDILTYNKKKIWEMRRKLQIIFQDPYSSLNPRMNVYNILSEPLVAHGYYKKGDELKQYILNLMEKCGLPPYYCYRYPHQFSGGQRQRIGIARSLALDPSFIVCDEPVSALDVSIQSQVLNLLRQLQESMGMAYIFISHNLSVIKHISDRVMVMYLGHVVELADKKELFANPSHPYTQALLSAIPVPERHSKRKKIILQGDLPSPANPPSGCIFHTRCFMAQEICSTQKPELRDIGGGHLCACHFCNGACAQNETTEEK